MTCRICQTQSLTDICPACLDRALRKFPSPRHTKKVCHKSHKPKNDELLPELDELLWFARVCLESALKP